ncbi:MAG: substrate-binding domain-containing protein, partial [Lachnospiraceae bacterium]|nr:substrate-binding domain-containing protein [Lachnospiraceae bacterium]
MKKRVLSVGLVVAMVLSMVVGCASGASSSDKSDTSAPAKTASGDDKYTIGCTVYYMSEFITLMVDGMQKKADDLGCDLVMLDANHDSEAQITQIENLIAQDVDCIIVAAVDSDAIVPAISMCEDANIPLVGVNMLINTDEPYYYVGPDDVKAGELEMQNAIDKIGGKGNVCILEGPIGQSAQLQRLEGNENVLAKNKDVTVLADQTANWDREEALTLVENWLETFDNIDAIIAHNDEMAMGAIQALEAAGKSD